MPTKPTKTASAPTVLRSPGEVLDYMRSALSGPVPCAAGAGHDLPGAEEIPEGEWEPHPAYDPLDPEGAPNGLDADRRVILSGGDLFCYSGASPASGPWGLWSFFRFRRVVAK